MPVRPSFSGGRASWFRAAAAVAAAVWLCGGAQLTGAEPRFPGTDEIRAAAEDGDPSAQVRLGSFYFSYRQYEQACHWFRKAAAQNDPEGEYNLAVCLAGGFGAAEDQIEALRLFRSASSKGLLPARLAAAKLRIRGIDGKIAPDPDGGLGELSAMAAIPYPPAANELGVMALEEAAAAAAAGDSEKAGAAREKAEKYFCEAADGDFAPACRRAAGMLIVPGGKDRETDLNRQRKGVYYLRRASEQGDAEATAQLAFCLETGIGSSDARDRGDEARALYEKAAAAGNPAAQLRMGEYILAGGEGVPGDPVRAFEYFSRAAASKLPAAVLRVGICHAEGLGTPEDKNMAAECFLNAAKAGNRIAQYNLACFFLNGDGIPKDDGAAFYWFRRAAEQGDTAAMRQLAFCYFNGTGTAVNEAEGVKWLKNAARSGDAEAGKLLIGE